MRQESNLQGREARPGSGRLPSASRIAHPCAEWVGLVPTRRLPSLACFGTGAVGSSASRSNAESEIRTPEPLVTPCTASNGAPRAIRTLSTRGRRADRMPAGLSPDLRLATACLRERLQIPDCAPQPIWVILHATDAYVAVPTEQPPDLASFVTVVYVQSPKRRRYATDGAATALLFQHQIVVIKGNPIVCDVPRSLLVGPLPRKNFFAMFLIVIFRHRILACLAF